MRLKRLPVGLIAGYAFTTALRRRLGHEIEHDDYRLIVRLLGASPRAPVWIKVRNPARVLMQRERGENWNR